MTAFEARQNSSNAEYELIMKKIQQASAEGYNWCEFTNCNSHPSARKISTNIFHKLSQKGFDVSVYYDKSGIVSCVNISWKNATEGRTGEVKHIMPKEESKKGFFARLLNPCLDSESDCYGGLL